MIILNDTFREASLRFINTTFNPERDFYEFVDYCYGKDVISVIDNKGNLIASCYMWKSDVILEKSVYILEYFCVKKKGTGIFLFRRILSFLKKLKGDILVIVGFINDSDRFLEKVGKHQKAQYDDHSPLRFVFNVNNY